MTKSVIIINFSDVVTLHAERNPNEDICKCNLVFDVDAKSVHFMGSPLFKIHLVETLVKIENIIKDSIE